MKKVLIIALVLLTSVAVNAQTKGKPSLSSQKSSKGNQQLMNAKPHHNNICQLKAYATKDGKMKIIVDFGDTKIMNDHQVKEMKSEGYTQSFTNTVDALRYMKKFGWRIVEGYAQDDINYFIMSRK